MSTLDPRLEPPGEWQSPYSSPPGRPGGPGGPTEAARKAALYAWLCAGAGLLMTCCCLLNAVAMMIQPQLIIDQILTTLPAELRGQVTKQHVVTASVGLAILYLLVLLIPSVALVFLGFGIRRGGTGQTAVAKWLVLFFALIAGLGLLLGVASLGNTGVLIVALLQLVIFGGWLWLTVTAFRKLRNLSRGSDEVGPMDPWGV